MHWITVPFCIPLLILSWICHSMRYSTVIRINKSIKSWRIVISRSLPPLRSFARTVCPPLAAGPWSLIHRCHGVRWSAAGSSPLLRRPLTIPRLGTDSEDRVCWNIASKSRWRHDQRGPVFVYGQCMRHQTGRYGAKLHRWTRNRASWCAGCVVGNSPVSSLHWLQVQCTGYIPVRSCCDSTVCCPSIWTLLLGRPCYH